MKLTSILKAGAASLALDVMALPSLPVRVRTS
jgi:hypothetical protein